MTMTPPPARAERTARPAPAENVGSAGPLEPVPDNDEREWQTFLQDQDPLDIAAATWAARKHDGLSAQAEEAFRLWLAEDPRHAIALLEMEDLLGGVRKLQQQDVARPRQRPANGPLHYSLRNARADASLIPEVVTGARRVHAMRLLQPMWPHAATAVTAFALVVGGWMGWSIWRRQPVFEHTYLTQRGQQLQVHLPDAQAMAPGSEGSALQLDTATQVQVRLYRDRREVHLSNGQAMFAVHSDPARPFHVYVGEVHVTVVGTRFAVRHTDTGLNAGQTEVAVEEGRVRVQPGRSEADDAGVSEPKHELQTSDLPPKAVELAAGQVVQADAQGRLSPVASHAGGSIAAWRAGRVSFDQTPLSEAIAEWERYGATGLVVRDPAVAAMRVGGSYSVRQWQHFAESLPQVLPVRLVRRGDVTEVVAQ